VTRISIRLMRFGFIAATAAAVIDALLQSLAFNSAAGTTAAARAAFGREMEALGQSTTYIVPLPTHPETMGGWLLWKLFSVVVMIFAAWALLSATGAARGDEDKGLIEQWLSAGLGRTAYVAHRFAWFTAAAVVGVALTLAAAQIGAAVEGLPMDAGGLAEAGIAVLAVAMLFYGVGLLVSQLTPSRSNAIGVGLIVMIVLFFVNSMSRSVNALQPLASVVSPFYYFDRTTAIAPGGTFEVWGAVGTIAAAVLLAGLATWLMQVRDTGSTLLRIAPREGKLVEVPASNPLFRIPVLSALFEQRIGLAAWIAGALIAAAAIASFGRPMVDTLVKGQGATMNGYLSAAGHGNPYVTVTGYFWFGVFQLLLSVFAIVQVSRWAADDQEGRLEMLLSAPVSRARVVLERGVAFAIATAVIVAVSSVGFYLVTHSSNIDVRAGDLVTASWTLLPFALSFTAIGALLATRMPRAMAGVLGAVAFVGYVITLGGPIFKWPDWTNKLSVFSLYGNPLNAGVYWDGFWLFVAVTVVGFGLGALLMRRRDIGA
jgi:ABC-2 type transport system permease protein